MTGLSAFIALCMTTDKSFQRTAASWSSVSPTMLRPLNVTLPPVMSAGGASSWAIANSRVDLPQPDSPTTPMNSPAAEVEAHVLDRADRAALHGVLDGQAPDLE